MDFIISECDNFNKKSNGLILTAEVRGNEDNTLILTLDGSLDTENSSKLSDFFLHIMRERGLFTRVIFNLKKLNYVSSTGIGTFVAILKETKLADIKLFLCNVNSNVLTILDMFGFTSFFTIVPTPDDIIAI